MPKIQLPELQALAEYLTGKVPRYGMFSTLKGLIDNSPRDAMTAQEWGGYLKPGQIATRQGLEFPLKQEELDYSGIPKWLSGYKPNEKISRDQLLGQYMAEAPDLRAMIGSKQAAKGNAREQQLAKRAGSLSNRVMGMDPHHSRYSHATSGDNPDGSRSPWGDDYYQEDVTTSPDFGNYPSHFSTQDISWNRTNRLPMWGESIGMGATGVPEGRTARIIDEIQSDRHQRARDPGVLNPTPENRERMQSLATDMLKNPVTINNGTVGPHPLADLHYYLQEPGNLPEEHGLTHDPRWQEIQQLIEASRGPRGYATPEQTQRVEELRQSQELRDPGRLQRQNQSLVLGPNGQWNSQVDPSLADRIRQMKEEYESLRNMVPDTPFKKTQGYAMLEMRKALADALHTGDSALGLASGEDQYKFYGEGFNQHQREGQNYAYDTSYPSVLKDLAKKMGLGYKPVDVTLSTGRDAPKNWPPTEMANIVGMRYPGDMTEEETRDPFTLEHFVAALQDLGLGFHDNHTALRRLYSQLFEKMPQEKRQELGLAMTPANSYPAEGYRAKFDKAMGDMSNYYDEYSKMTNPVQRWEDDGDTETQAWHDLMRSQAYQNNRFNYSQSMKDAAEAMRPMYDWYKSQFGPGAPQPTTDLRQKTFQNAIDLSDPDAAARAKAAGVPVWNTGGQVDHVMAALHRMGKAEGGEVRAAQSVADLVKEFTSLWQKADMPHFQGEDMNRLAEIHSLLKEQGVDSKDLVRERGPTDQMHSEGGEVDPSPDYGSSLNRLKNAALNATPQASESNWLTDPTGVGELLSGDNPARGTLNLAKLLYGTDKGGHIVFGGGAWTPEQGGTPMSILDSIAGMPSRIGKLADTVLGHQDTSRLRPWEKVWADEEPSLEGMIPGSKEAAGREDAFNEKVEKSAALPKAHSLAGHFMDNAGIVLPVPGLAAEGLGSHLAGFLGGSSLKNFPRMSAEWQGINAALESLTDKLTGHKPSGQMDPAEIADRAAHADGGQPPAPNESLGQGTPPAQPESPTEESLLNDMLQRRILMRQSALPVPMPAVTPSPFPTGGLVEADVDPARGFDWGDIRRRLAILKNPLIQGKPPSLIPPLPKARSSEDVSNEAQVEQFRNKLGSLMNSAPEGESEQLGPAHFSSQDSDIMDMLRAKLMTNRLTSEDVGSAQTAPSTYDQLRQWADSVQSQARGGPARGSLRGRRQGNAKGHDPRHPRRSRNQADSREA